nr:diguanylate cyclase [Phosphitispora fastidiosa]
MFIDGLTGTYNHKFFQETLTGEINRAAKTGKPLSMLMMDLDRETITVLTGKL